MKILNQFSFLLLCIIILSCDSKSSKTQETETEQVANVASRFPLELQKVFDAHGGYDSWSKMQALSFAMEKGEIHETSLWDRKALITSDLKTIGFDGQQVWVTPDTIPVGSARFYYSVYFYFYAMPFVLGDPGIKYELLKPKDLMGSEYGGIKISYENGIGDAPKDNYILWYDPVTFRMEWLMYTVTFGSDEASDDYRLIRYSEWSEFSGLKLPTKLDWYVYNADTVGDLRNSQVFSNVSLSEMPFEAELFQKPENAQVAD